MTTSDNAVQSCSLRHFQSTLDIKLFRLRHCQSSLQQNWKSVLGYCQWWCPLKGWSILEYHLWHEIYARFSWWERHWYLHLQVFKLIIRDLKADDVVFCFIWFYRRPKWEDLEKILLWQLYLLLPPNILNCPRRLRHLWVRKRTHEGDLWFLIKDKSKVDVQDEFSVFFHCLFCWLNGLLWLTISVHRTETNFSFCEMSRK